MHTPRSSTTWGAAAVASLLLLTGCAGDSQEDPNADAAETATAATETTPPVTEEADGGETGSPAAAGDDNAAAMVERATAPVEDFTPPGPPLDDLSSLAGGTVWYIPATFQVPMFLNVGDALAEALGNLDIEVQTCDGKANPGDIASCLNQALDADADAVIAGSIPDELAPTAFEQIRQAGVPLLYMQTAPAGPGAPTSVGYLTPNNIEMQAWLANWVITDSGADADVLVVKINDTPATILWVDEGAIGTYEGACPDCEVTVIETNTGQLSQLPSLVSSALTSNPDIGYVHVAFDVAVQPTIQGIQSAGLGADEIALVSQDGTLPVMQNLANGQFVSAAVGFNQEALAWYGADQVLRMMSGQDSVQSLDFPYRRLFTGDVVTDLDITEDARGAGTWFGDATYTDGFLELWGAS